ncbi:binding-protein-dependent transport systems inner membrane component [Agrococcus casei LMG 22410]|uniref:Binding-protein-dependent transport systems inner membrane component n=3 Tax=Agrococcus TaxID=46352 RepID=A0A1R4GB40_9MICO|nr:binding-protein-dependent transport systems inner membrane component [Agrococcus casei LMG 22410]
MTGMTQRRSANSEAAIGNRTRAIATMSPGEARGQNKKLKRSGSMPWWQRFGLAVILPVLFVIVWQYVASTGSFGGGMLPTFTDSVEALRVWMFGQAGDSYFAGGWLASLGASALRVFSGFSIGAVLAITLGLFSGVSQNVRGMVDPFITILRPISVTAWVPMALIIFGIGYAPAIFLTALGTFFPVYVATLAGVRYSEGSLVHAARMLGANKRQTLLRVTLPATLPSIATGMRVAAGIAWTCVVVAEMLGAKSGLGYTLILAYNQFQFDYIAAAMASIGAAGYLTDKLIEQLIQRRLRWAMTTS